MYDVFSDVVLRLVFWETYNTMCGAFDASLALVGKAHRLIGIRLALTHLLYTLNKDTLSFCPRWWFIVSIAQKMGIDVIAHMPSPAKIPCGSAIILPLIESLVFTAFGRRLNKTNAAGVEYPAAMLCWLWLKRTVGSLFCLMSLILLCFR